MRLLIMSIKDKVTNEFMTPFYVHNIEEGARAFKFNLTKTELWKDNAEQFELYTLGILDTNTGNIIGSTPNHEGEIDTLHPDMNYKGNDILS